MTEAAPSPSPAAPAVGASDVLTSIAAPAAAPAPAYLPIGFPKTPDAFHAPEAVAARAAIEERKADLAFGKKLLAKDPAASAEWTGLHKAAYPSPQQIASVEDVNSQAAARAAEQFNKYFGWLKQQFSLTPENEAEIRGGVIRADLHEWARNEKDRMIADRGWRKQFFDGDRKAREVWTRITLML